MGLIDVSKFLNTRDLGGLPTGNGHAITHGVIYRTAALANALPGICAEFAQNDGRPNFIDLRNAAELGDAQAASAGGVVVHRHPIADEACTKRPPAERDELYFVQQYTGMLRSTLPAVRTLCMVIAAGGAPVVVGCRLGKDRTGVVVMILLRLLGVPEKRIAEDFGLTALAYATQPEWVTAYAAARGEDYHDVLRRCTLPSAVALRVLRHHQMSLPRLTEAAGIDDAVLGCVRKVMSSRESGTL